MLHYTDSSARTSWHKYSSHNCRMSTRAEAWTQTRRAKWNLYRCFRFCQLFPRTRCTSWLFWRSLLTKDQNETKLGTKLTQAWCKYRVNYPWSCNEQQMWFNTRGKTVDGAAASSGFNRKTTGESVYCQANQTDVGLQIFILESSVLFYYSLQYLKLIINGENVLFLCIFLDEWSVNHLYIAFLTTASPVFGSETFESN